VKLDAGGTLRLVTTITATSSQDDYYDLSASAGSGSSSWSVSILNGSNKPIQKLFIPKTTDPALFLPERPRDGDDSRHRQ